MVPISGVLAILLLATPPEEPVPNILTNTSFEAKLSGWKASPLDTNSETGRMDWSRRDAESKPSGSLELATSATGDRYTFRVGQCARLDKRSENLMFGGRILVPVDQKARGLANVELERFESTDCTGEVIPYEGLGGLTNADYWSNRRELVAAANAKSVRLVAVVQKIYEWREGDEIGETDDGNVFRAYFDDLFVGPLMTPVEAAPEPPDAARFAAPAGTAKRARWGPHTVAAPTLSLAVLGPDGKAHREGIVVECSSLESVRIALTLKNPHEEEDIRWYPLQAVSLPGEGSPGSRSTAELGIFRAGDKGRKLVPIVCDVGDPTAVRVIGDRSERIGGIREFYTCLRGSLPAEARQKVPEKPTDDELLAWPLAGALVANPPGEYEVVGRYQALEAGFWHDPIFSNTVKIRITKKEPCPPAAP